MSDKVFIDTNIWIYAKIEGKEVDKHEAARNFLTNLEYKPYISTQVINEFFNTLVKNNIDD